MERLVPITALILLWRVALCQQARDVFNPQVPIVWLGLDFRQAWFIADYVEFRTVGDGTKLIVALNDPMLSGHQKYDVGRRLGKQKAEQRLDVSMVRDRFIMVLKLFGRKS